MKNSKNPIFQTISQYTFLNKANEDSENCYFIIYEENYSTLKSLRVCYENKSELEKNQKKFEEIFDKNYASYVKKHEDNFIYQEYQTSIPFVALMYKKMGCTVIGLDPVKQRCKLAKKMGVAYTIDSLNQKEEEEINKINEKYPKKDLILSTDNLNHSAWTGQRNNDSAKGQRAAEFKSKFAGFKF